MKHIAFCCGALLIYSTYSFCGNADGCDKALKDGVFNYYQEHRGATSALLETQAFCSEAKSDERFTTNYENLVEEVFSKSAAENMHNNAALKASYVLMSGEIRNEFGRASENMSNEEKKRFLKTNKEKVLSAYEKTCGNSSKDEQKQSELSLIQKTASTELLDAWRKCRESAAGGLYSYLESQADSDAHIFVVGYRSNHPALEVESLKLQFNDEVLSFEGHASGDNVLDGPYGQFRLDFVVTHKDTKKGAAIVARGPEGISNQQGRRALLSTSVFVPSKAQIFKKAMIRHSDDEMRAMIANDTDEKEVKHSDDYMRQLMSDVTGH